MFKLVKCFFYCLVGILVFNGCASDQYQKRRVHFQQWIQNNSKIKVLSTTAIIDDIVRRVGGEYVNTIVLIEGQLDPHSYQLVKGDDEKLAFAQLIFYNGLGLEHGPSLHTHLLNNPKAIALGDLIDQQQSGQIIYVHGQKDPHIWMDILLWSKTIPLIVQALSQQDPAHAEEYQMNGQTLQQEMESAHRKTIEIMHQVPPDKRYLVTSHDAFNYFARAYLSDISEVESGKWEKRFAAPEGLAPESQLSTLDIKNIIEYLKRYQIRLIFPESNVSRDSIRKIVQACQEEGFDVQIACCALYGDTLGEPGSEGDTYLKMIHYNTQTLAEHMNFNFKSQFSQHNSHKQEQVK